MSPNSVCENDGVGLKGIRMRFDGMRRVMGM